MNGWYDNAYDKAPTLSISIQIARTKDIRLYCGQQRGTSNPVSCDIAPLNVHGITRVLLVFYYEGKIGLNEADDKYILVTTFWPKDGLSVVTETLLTVAFKVTLLANFEVLDISFFFK